MNCGRFSERSAPPAWRRSRVCAARIAAAVALLALAVVPAADGRPDAHSVPRTVAQENALRGSAAPSISNISEQIVGYASEVSVFPGQAVHLHVSTTPPQRYHVELYRLGWYHGLGARRLPCGCGSVRAGRAQPLAPMDPATGMVRESWPVTDVLRIPRSAVSGYYVAKLVPAAGRSSIVPFVVKRPAGATPSRVLVVTDFNTIEAYNNWGGKSLYSFNSSDGTAANHVSFDRPFAGNVGYFDVPFIRFLESQKLDISYATDVDVDLEPQDLLRHHLVVVIGHDEYWTKRMMDAYQAARDGGVNLAFFGGDYAGWQTRYEDADRTLVEYRNAAADPEPDPALKTVNFSRLVPPRPECQVIGTEFSGTGNAQAPLDAATRTFRVADASDPWFAGTGFKTGDLFQAQAYEADEYLPGCIPWPATIFFGDASNPNLAAAVRYRAPSGATVFGAGSYALSMGSLADPRLHRFAENVLAALNR
jgi:hypothetical protein